jgi:1-acyl-sn-glycerol-3-phosphate acyltransferase
MKRFLRIVVFTLSLYLVTHIVVFFTLPAALILGVAGRMDEMERLKTRFAKTVFRIVGQEIYVTGIKHINPETRYLIIANYPSGYALFALITLFPKASFVAHEFISRIPLLGQIMKRWGTIFVDSKHPIRTYRAIDKALEAGLPGNLIIMPEGGRSPDGTIHLFKRGFVHILKHSNLDLLPVTLNGFYKLKPANRITLDPDTRLEILVGEPICNGYAREMSDEKLIEMVAATIKGKYKP